MLYVVLIVCGQVMALIRPRKHSIHPAGLAGVTFCYGVELTCFLAQQTSTSC